VRKVWAVIRREFVERVRSRWFWVSAALGPVFLAALVFLPILFARSGGMARIVVVDGTATSFGVRVADSLRFTPVFNVVARSAPRPGLLDSLTQEVTARTLDGFLVLTAETVETGVAEYRASNVSSQREISELKGVLARSAMNARLERAGVSPDVVNRATLQVDLRTKKISGSKTSGESSAQSFSLAFIMSIVLFTTIVAYGVNVMSSVLEEKTTRVVEVLVSSVRPFQLMLGKILGVGSVSIVQFLIWGVSARILLTQRAALTGGVSAENGSGLEWPQVSAATIAIFLAYFLGGFLFYSSMLAAVGAMSSNEQEARQAQQPVIFLLMLAYLSIWAISSDPQSTYSVAISLIPFTSPIAMPVRWAASMVTATELVTSFALLILGIAAVTWVAARIYRVGILMTGKRPSLRELARWVRA
jgi:ABC-2 type transport system permease protein